MRRYLVVAHRTLGGPHLLEHLRERSEEEPTRFHLLVPAEHPEHAWTEGSIRAAAEERLGEGLAQMTEAGLDVDGEAGDANPVYAVGVVLRREGPETFAGVIVSTLPTSVSRWLRIDVPHRLRREHPQMPITHLVAAPAAVG